MAARSTRFFWASGDSQIYPELRALAEAGYLEANDRSTGGRAIRPAASGPWRSCARSSPPPPSGRPRWWCC